MSKLRNNIKLNPHKNFFHKLWKKTPLLSKYAQNKKQRFHERTSNIEHKIFIAV